MNTHAVHTDRLPAIEQARHSVLHEHDVQAAGLPEWVERSWRRCLARGQTPGQSVSFEPVSAEAMRRAVDGNRPLLQAAAPVIRSLARAMADTRYFAILTDAKGIVIDVHGPVDRHNPHANAIARVGVDLSEEAVGTTAIGTTLKDLQPVWLHRGEHFFADATVFSCAGAPVFGPDGRCVGMLDLTGVEVPERPALKHLVAQSARSIENALTLAQPHAMLLRLQWPGRWMGEDSTGLLCLNADGQVTGANRVAADMLDLPDTHRSAHAESLFAVPLGALWDAARSSRAPMELPLWSGLRLQVQAQLSTRAREGDNGRLPLRDMESALIRKAVDDAQGNVVAAARALGISRATVYRKLGKR
jgi:transcriptional regulator of acetoin/glycerol metabolism